MRPRTEPNVVAKDAHAMTAERCPGPSWVCHTRRTRVPFDAVGGVVSVLSTTGGTLPAECRDRCCLGGCSRHRSHLTA